MEKSKSPNSVSHKNTASYDLIIIGGGPGGYHAAIRAAQYGAKVALIEKDKVGGTCLNRGCIPTKTLYSSAKLLEDIRNKSFKFGIDLLDEPKVNIKRVVQFKNELISKMVSDIEALLKKNEVDLYHGFGTINGGNITSGFDICVNGNASISTKISGKRVILATGSTPALISQFNIDHERILTSDDILAPEFQIVPETLLIIGGGVIGCEFAYIFSQLGSKVIILEYLDSILATEERSIVKELKKKFNTMNIEIHETINCLNVQNNGKRIEACTCSSKLPPDQIEAAEKTYFQADYCLVSIGRAKFTNNLGLENTQIQTERGQIVVNPLTLETEEPGIYAIGDVTGGLMLAHVASYEGDVAVHNALATIADFDIEPMRPTYDVVPAAVFTNPEIASVGLKEKSARALGYNVFIGRFSYAALAKAKSEGEEEGFMMVIGDQETDEILGASCIGAEAPELIAELALAINNNLTIHDITRTVHSHPTMSELVLEACEDIYGLSIHKARRRREPTIYDLEISPEIMVAYIFSNLEKITE
ncbi:MAG: dihydrolipoyl dehydrogenase [Promethearchaeota archaeon]